MASKMQAALNLASKGFYVFPLMEKLPYFDEWQLKATRDPAQIKEWWTCPVMGYEQNHNIGIYTGRYRDNEALLVVDVDIKDGRHGDKTLLALENKGFLFPPTLENTTAGGGRHLVYRVGTPVNQHKADILGEGLDIRSRGGFIVAPSSTIGEREYRTDVARDIAVAPQWLVEKCGTEVVQPRKVNGSVYPIDAKRAEARAIEYLKKLDIVAKGSRTTTGYRVAATLKDLGVDQERGIDLMLRYWRTNPSLEEFEVEHVVYSAFRYGKSAPGTRAPESTFVPLDDSGVEKTGWKEATHPFSRLNAEYAYLLSGGKGHIIWETTDEEEKPYVAHLTLQAFHELHAAWMMQIEDKLQPVTKLWMRDKQRRTYRGICFRPLLTSPPGFYNLWRGFAVEPAPPGTRHQAVDKLLEHVHLNVCQNNPKYAHWLMGYFAHMVQMPWEKPQTSIVFRGSKGVGKNALVERIGYLFGGHFMLTASRRYLISNFNGHMEHLLFLVLNEAFWSGDKEGDGILKELITGQKHLIEHKGEDQVVQVSNLARIGILGEEDWIVPATHDERRYAVFDVGDGRKQDGKFFASIKHGMESGGYQVLLRYLMDYDISDVNIHVAPSTKALLEQKLASLAPFEQWWFASLMEGRLIGGDVEGWPTTSIATDRFRHAMMRYLRDRNIRSWVPDERVIGRKVRLCIPNVRKIRLGAAKIPGYVVPSLEQCRADWEKHVGQTVEWD